MHKGYTLTTSSVVLKICTSVISPKCGYVIQKGRGNGRRPRGVPMTELRKHEADMNLARQYPVSVLITAPPDRAQQIATAIADDDRDMGHDLVVIDVHRLSDVQQVELMRLLDTATDEGPRRIIATSSTSLFERVQEGTFLGELFYRLNVIHIVSDPCSEGLGTSSRPIIAA